MKNNYKKISIISSAFLIFFLVSFIFKSFIILLLSIIIFSLLLTLSSKINKNFLLFYFTFLISIFFAEIFLKIDFNKIFKSKEMTSKKEVIDFDDFRYESTYLGNQLKQGTYKHFKRKDNNYIFNINYKINSDNFRVNKLIKNEDDKPHKISFFGGSDIFGWGLEDSETLPYLFYKNNKDFNIFNYGIIGGGVNQTLYMIKKNNNYLGDINVVVTSSYQLPRLACNRDYSFNTPYFKLAGDELLFGGYCIFSFLKLNFQVPRTFGSVLNRSELIKLLNNVFSKEGSDETIGVYIKILQELHELADNSDKDLIILYYGPKNSTDQKIKDFLILNKVPFIDVSLYNEKFFIKHDKHFNKLAIETWFDKLTKYLVTIKG